MAVTNGSASGSYTIAGSGSSGIYSIAAGTASGSFTISPAGSSGKYTIATGTTSGSFIITPAGSSGSYQIAIGKASGSFIITPAGSSGTYRIISSTATYLGALTMSVDYDAGTFTITDATDYTGNGETRSSFALTVTVTNLRDNEAIPTTPNVANTATVTSWTGNIPSVDTILQVHLLDSGSTVRVIDGILSVGSVLEKVNEIEDEVADACVCSSLNDVQDHYMKIYGYYAGVKASFELMDYNKTFIFMEDIEFAYNDFLHEKNKDVK